MARKMRMEYSGAIYHVMSRGDHGDDIFDGDQDRELFLETLGQACGKTGWQIHAWCLLSNHFHLVIETPEANLVAGMKWLMGTFTARFNRRHKLFGHLFSGRYKAIMVDGSGNGYLATVCHYVHLNAARAGLLARNARLESYAWSSYPDYLKKAGQRVPWLRVDRLLGEMRIPKDSVAGRRRLREAMDERLSSEDEEYPAAEHGWYHGDDAFREELLERVKTAPGKWAYGELVHESQEHRAEKLVRQLLRDRGWKETELATRRKGDPEKVEMARVLKEQSVVTNAWIAERLNMGARQHLTHLLYWQKRQGQREGRQKK